MFFCQKNSKYPQNTTSANDAVIPGQDQRSYLKNSTRPAIKQTKKQKEKACPSSVLLSKNKLAKRLTSKTLFCILPSAKRVLPCKAPLCKFRALATKLPSPQKFFPERPEQSPRALTSSPTFPKSLRQHTATIKET